MLRKAIIVHKRHYSALNERQYPHKTTLVSVSLTCGIDAARRWCTRQFSPFNFRQYKVVYAVISLKHWIPRRCVGYVYDNVWKVSSWVRILSFIAMFYARSLRVTQHHPASPALHPRRALPQCDVTADNNPLRVIHVQYYRWQAC